MSVERNAPATGSGASSAAAITEPTPREQYEGWFRKNRDSAIEDGYDLICPTCGCAFNAGDDEWANHDGSLHRLYDAIQEEQA